MSDARTKLEDAIRDFAFYAVSDGRITHPAWQELRDEITAVLADVWEDGRDAGLWARSSTANPYRQNDEEGFGR